MNPQFPTLDRRWFHQQGRAAYLRFPQVVNGSTFRASCSARSPAEAERYSMSTSLFRQEAIG